MAGVVVALVSLVVASAADTIRLKNGTAITADRVSDKGDVVEYFVGSTRYTVAKSAVAKIERGGSFGITVSDAPAGMTVRGSGSAEAPAMPREKLPASLPTAPTLTGVDAAALEKEIITYGHVDDSALNKIEAQGSRWKTAAAYFLAAKFEFEQRDGDAARRYMKRCVELAPEQAGFHAWYAVLLLDGAQYGEAVTQAEQAVKESPQSAGAYQIAGLAYYDSGRLNEAVEAWNRAQAIQPTEAVATYLEKASRESKVEGAFNESESSHFTLRYEGRQTGMTFRTDLLRELDRDYDDISRELGFAPARTITVVLYTEQQFFDVTQAPSWAGGINDGKLRIPVKDVSSITPRLESVLRHELTHSFVHSLAGPRCPTWLNEGLAQMEEPRGLGSLQRPLGELYRSGKAAPLHALEGSFTRFGSEQAQVAYAEALAATEYLSSRYGMSRVKRVLELVGDGEDTEAALGEALQTGYAQLDKDVAEWVERK